MQTTPTVANYLENMCSMPFSSALSSDEDYGRAIKYIYIGRVGKILPITMKIQISEMKTMYL